MCCVFVIPAFSCNVNSYFWADNQIGNYIIALIKLKYDQGLLLQFISCVGLDMMSGYATLPFLFLAGFTFCLIMSTWLYYVIIIYNMTVSIRSPGFDMLNYMK